MNARGAKKDARRMIEQGRERLARQSEKLEELDARLGQGQGSEGDERVARLEARREDLATKVATLQAAVDELATCLAQPDSLPALANKTDETSGPPPSTSPSSSVSPTSRVRPGVTRRPGSQGAATGRTPPILPTVSATDVATLRKTQFNFPPQDEQGFSILKPSPDSRIIYVSAKTGDDSGGVAYSASSPEVGDSPSSPRGPIQAFRTIERAMSMARPDSPDWVLLERGCAWDVTETVSLQSGRSPTERSVVTHYGSAVERPLVRTGTGQQAVGWMDGKQFSALMGIHFYADRRDPKASNFAGFGSGGEAFGFRSHSREGAAPNRSLLVEDAVFEFYSTNIIARQGSTDIIVRRSQFLNNYSTTSHAQGIYSTEASIFLEENLFDHNGWFQKGGGDRRGPINEGQATLYNHNLYFTNTRNTVLYRNIFSRSSSIGAKFTANPPETGDLIMAANIFVEDNLFVEGEVGVSAGGNADRGTGARWGNVQIMNNVLLNLGRDRPTGRKLGWGLDVLDWDGGRISGNIIASVGTPEVRNVYAVHLIGHMRNVEVANNIVYDLFSPGAAIIVEDSANKENLRIFGNQVQLPGSQMAPAGIEGGVPGMLFYDNVYYTDRTQGTFYIHKRPVDFETWKQESKDKGSRIEKVEYPDPGRTIESYNASLGGKSAYLDFLGEVKQQSKAHWRPAYTAASVNHYVREGYGQSDPAKH